MKLLQTRTGVPEFRGPALVCLGAIDKNRLNPSSPHGALKHHFTSLKNDLISRF